MTTLEPAGGAPASGGTVDTDVLVVGAGPCGLTVANLLGGYGVRTVVVERARTPISYPRAVGIDDESLRSLQTVGLVDEVLADTIQNTPIRYYTSWGRCFAHVKPSAKPYGWPRRNLFLQPRLEATLRAGLTRFGCLDVRFGTELAGVATDDDGVSAELAGDGGTTTVRARYLVGADGGRSLVRQLAGIELLGTTAPVKWLVVDVDGDTLDAPYSAVHCDTRRPVLMVPLPYRHRRWEFKVQPGEDEEALTSEASVRALLAPHYGSTPLPTIVSARVYLHHSRTAATFRSGRMFLAGDAAHLQPPFFGQGMNSGLRDATNLAWKLAAVTSGRAGADLLGTYDAERRPHAAEMVGFATRIGRMYSPRSTVTERIRDVGFRGLQLVPGGREYILQMRYKPMPHYTEGLVVHPAAGDAPGADQVGRMFMQPLVETGGRRVKLDDAIGGWFAVLGLGTDADTALPPEALAWWERLGACFVRVDPARSGPPPAVGSAVAAPVDLPAGHVVVEDVDGAFRDWRLARPGGEIIVLRPDRYVAAVTDRAGFVGVTDRLRTLMGEGTGIRVH